MIGQYWGKRFSVNRLQEISNADRSGASLHGLISAAESIGFNTRPIKTNLAGLAKQELPAIAHWEGKHYIVVYKISKTQVIVGDPAIGQRSFTHEEFTAGWTGYTLLLQPTTLLKDAEGSNIPFWQFVELIKPHRVILLEIFLASLVIQVLGLTTPIFTQLLLDRVVVQRSTLTLNAIGLGLLIFGLFKVAMSGLRRYLLDHVAKRIDVSLIVGFITHTLRLPLSYFESRYVGDIISRIQENRKIQRFLTGETISILLDLLTMFVYAGLMLWYSWKLTLLVLIIVPPFFLLALIATPFLRRISRETFATYNEQTKYLIQSLTGIRTVKALAVEQTVRWHWEELFGKAVKKSFSGEIISNTLFISSSTIQTLVTTSLLWFGVWQVINDELTIGQLVAFNMLKGNVISPFQRLTFVWNELQEIIIAIERLNDVIDAQPEEDLQTQLCTLLPPIRGHIKFENVTFRYHAENDSNVLENVSFEVQPGQTVALVGRSGSGKTTLSKLCLGFYLPTEGKIIIDGYDLANLSLESLRRQMGVVDRDTFLFGGTIRENISIAYPEAELEQVIEAATQAGAHEFIAELPMGYETQIGEGGGTLSGGQKQRLAIAKIEALAPDVALVDIEMPVMGGLEVTQIIKERFADTKVIILSSHVSNEYVEEALKAGAKGYLLKNASAEEIAHAVRYVYQGCLHLAPDVSKDRGIIAEIQVVDRENIVREKKGSLQQAQLDLEQARLRLQEQEKNYKGSIQAGNIAVLRNEEQLKEIEMQIGTLTSQIRENQTQIDALDYQLEQRIIKAPVNGVVFQLPVQKTGSVLESGGLVAEIAPEQAPLIVKAQISSSESGFLESEMPVKLKFDAYPFQDYGIVEGILVKISPTTKIVDTEAGKIEAYELDIELDRNYILARNKRIALKPGQKVTAEIIIRQRRLIDFVLDPFKKLEENGLEL